MKLVTIKSRATFNSNLIPITGKLVEIQVGNQLHEFVIRTDGTFNDLIHYPSGGMAIKRMNKPTKKCATQAMSNLVARWGVDKVNDILNNQEVLNT